MSAKRITIALFVGVAAAGVAFRFLPVVSMLTRREKALASGLIGVGGYEATRFVQSFIPETSIVPSP